MRDSPEALLRCGEDAVIQIHADRARAGWHSFERHRSRFVALLCDCTQSLSSGLTVWHRFKHLRHTVKGERVAVLTAGWHWCERHKRKGRGTVSRLHSVVKQWFCDCVTCSEHCLATEYSRETVARNRLRRFALLRR